jgi:hypothetical protein
MTQKPNNLTKLRWSLPWLSRYPASRLRAHLERTFFEKKHVIITIADHFEPGWSNNGILGHADQLRRLKEYHQMARSIGNSVVDEDGTKFRHTNFYPAEQYQPDILDIMAEMQSEGLGEVEVHLHHGDPGTDTEEYLRRELSDFRDTLAERHRCLSRDERTGDVMYSFVHGNLALDNSCAGMHCGVDNEMAILAETGCYADFTMPSAPDRTQVPVLNQIYECALPLDQPSAHSKGNRIGIGSKLTKFPLIFSGPLVFNWRRRVRGLPVPRIEDGALASNQDLDMERFNRWVSANVTVAGRSDWVFVKLYCHGFFDHDQPACIGEDAKRFFGDLVENAAKDGKFKIHFASAREAFNIAMAAVDGRSGDPNDFRNHRLKAIMKEETQQIKTTASATANVETV